jgi:hypothetical protein
MPLDALGTTVLPLNSNERWSVNPNALDQPRQNFHPTNDNAALYIIGNYLKYHWAKRFNDGENHCIVGWVAQVCEPRTAIPHGYSEQSRRLLKRLHNALPTSAQRPTRNHAWTLAKYNDTHQHNAVLAVAERAYKMYINETWGKHNGRWPYPDVGPTRHIVKDAKAPHPPFRRTHSTG